jgi:uncharacterized membrane protein
VLGVVVYLVAIALAPTVTTYSDYGNGAEVSASAGFGVASDIVVIVGYVVLFIVGFAIQSAYTSGLLDIANGQQVTVGSFFKPRNLGNFIVAGLILAILVGIGTILCVIPGVIVAFFTIWTIYALLDRNLSPVDAIKASVEMTRANVLNTFLAWLISSVIISIGAVVCYVGLLVAAPLGSLFLVYSYRRLSGGQVAPVTS